MTMTTDLFNRTVGELAAQVPASIPIFEAWQIDYCCGGKTQLADACAASGRTIDDFAAALKKAATLPDASHNWLAYNLAAMASSIVETYHSYTRTELETLVPLGKKVLGVHGERRPELAEVVSLIGHLCEDMIPHMLKEEQVLFPYVDQLEAGAAPTPFFGTVRNPVRMMMLEHDRVGELLARLREVTAEYTPPESACFSYRQLYGRLAIFEARTHEHVHVENNIYFPRAVALEEQVGKAPAFTAPEGTCGAGCSH